VAVTHADVRRMAELARLALDDRQIDAFTVQLRSILAHVEHLEAADDVSREPGDEASPVPARTRVDRPGADPLHAAPAVFACAWQDGFFTLPRLTAMDDGGEDENMGA